MIFQESILDAYLTKEVIRPRTKPYTKCPPRLASAGRWPKGWFQGENPVIALCIGINVRIHKIKPYNIPNSEIGITMVEKVKREIMNGKAVPARVPFRK